MKIAIIPARGGSKRIPKKNIKSFHGKPIIAYAIEIAIKSKLFDAVYVSTDDEEIEIIARQYKAEIHKRSSKNADDFATTSDVIIEVLSDLEKKLGRIDLLCCIYPTSPMIRIKDLRLAYKIYRDNICDVVLAASQFSFPPQRGFTVENNFLLLTSPQYINMRSQDLEKIYHDAGAFYFIDPKFIKNNKNFWDGNIRAVILNESSVQDIDSEEDWKMAELKYQLMISSEKNNKPIFEEWTKKKYECLNKQIFTNGQFKIVPIRSIDRFEILKWRNEQEYHLRQKGKLSIEQQNSYFQKTVSTLFNENQPNQILFSFLKNDICIGYGGLVHINWIDKHAEISFIMNTELEKTNFASYWNVFLKLIDELAFEELNFHKIYTFAFDLRPKLYPILEIFGFTKEAEFKEHILFNNEYINVIIHSKFNNK